MFSFSFAGNRGGRTGTIENQDGKVLETAIETTRTTNENENITIAIVGAANESRSADDRGLDTSNPQQLSAEQNDNNEDGDEGFVEQPVVNGNNDVGNEVVVQVQPADEDEESSGGMGELFGNEEW